MSNVKHDTAVDALKAVAIILVIIGHMLVLYHPDDYSTDLMFKICYSFHMPLFIFISGYLNGMRDNRHFDAAWMIRRNRRLLWPYVVWTIIAFAISRLKGTGDRSLFNYLLIDPAVWFLITLWIYSVMLFISVKFKNWIAVLFIEGILFASLYVIFRDANIVIKDVVNFIPFFIGGVLFGRLTLKIGKRSFSRGKFRLIPLVLYPLSMTLFFYGNYPPHILRVQEILNISGHSFIIHAALMFYNHIVVAVLGIWFVWVLVKMMMNQLERESMVKSQGDRDERLTGERNLVKTNNRISARANSNRIFSSNALSFIQYVGGGDLADLCLTWIFPVQSARIYP